MVKKLIIFKVVFVNKKFFVVKLGIISLLFGIGDKIVGIKIFLLGLGSLIGLCFCLVVKIGSGIGNILLKFLFVVNGGKVLIVFDLNVVWNCNWCMLISYEEFGLIVCVNFVISVRVKGIYWWGV